MSLGQARGDSVVLFEGAYRLDILTAITAFNVSPDSQRFLKVKRAEMTAARSQIILVQNWVEELTRLVPTHQPHSPTSAVCDSVR